MSPHARGCSAPREVHRQGLRDVPARAGMLRKTPTGSRRTCRCPRTRGDAPRSRRTRSRRGAMSPHARGCSGDGVREAPPREDVPARAGMLRACASTSRPAARCPRTRGDAPRRRPPGYSPGCDVPARAGMLRTARNASIAGRLLSPHARGCSVELERAAPHAVDVPARAGMLRCTLPSRRWRARCPRTRGDAPLWQPDMVAHNRMSPHARGCSEGSFAAARMHGDVPARAGMLRRPAPG